MDTLSSNRSQRRKALTRQNLVDSAKNLFAEKGYAGATIDDIAEYADVAKVTFYYHFKSKEEIAMEIRRQCIVEAAQYVEEISRKNLPADKMIAAFVEDVSSWTEENWKLLDVFCSQRLNPLIDSQDKGEEKQEPMIMCIDAIIKKGQEKGEFRLDLDRLQVARIIDLSILCEQNKWIKSGRKPGSLALELNRCFGLIVNGIRQT